MNKNGRKILLDHKRVGQKFVPPMRHLLGDVNTVKWHNSILPEIIWIGVMQEKLGDRRTADICGKIAKACVHIFDETKVRSMLCFISAYDTLDAKQKTLLIDYCGKEDILDDISYALNDFAILYPASPINMLVAYKDVEYVFRDIVVSFKEILNKYFYRGRHKVNIMEATTVYMLKLSENCVFSKGAPPPDVEAIFREKPDDSQYKRVASIVRALVTGAVGTFVANNANNWPGYFWNRGFEIDGCIKIRK